MIEHLLEQKKSEIEVGCSSGLEEGIHILMADDNPLNQKLVRIMLRNSGYRLSVAKDGEEAVAVYTSEPDKFDMILMDIRMPRMDGRKAAKVIRDMGFRNIPIIAMTAASMEDHREECLQCGMNDYIAKPIEKESVLQMVKKWCGN